MNKKFILLFAILCQLLLTAKELNGKSIFVDPSVAGLTAPTENSNSEAYHIFSHGQSGELFIDNHWLNAAQISTRFKNELKGKKELYIYGCNFGEGEKGRQAVQYLEDHLNIKVNASTNITGKSGDWNLELGSGKNGIKLTNFKGNLQLDNTHYLNPITSAKYDDTTIFEEYIYIFQLLLRPTLRLQ